MKKILIMLFVLHLGSTFAQHSREQFPDVLKLGYKVSKPFGIETNVFSDLGAWHAYTLPSDTAGYGAFVGPMVMDMEGQWLSASMSRLSLKVAGIPLNLGQGKASLHYYPGLLQQEFQLSGLKILLQLIFVSKREAMVRTRISNVSKINKNIELSWSGESLIKDGLLLHKGNGIQLEFNKGHMFQLAFPAQQKLSFTVSGKSYTAKLAPVELKVGNTYSLSFSERYYLQASEIPKTPASYNFQQAYAGNQQRWDKYLDLYFKAPGAPVKDTLQKRLAVKSIVTLMSNWRSKAKDLLHDGLFPSLNYQGFYGFWSWDSWKQAAGLSYFAPALAKENMLAMFDYQDKQGMVADCIYTDKKENNWRDTKPPLAAWAVWEIYGRDRDKAFLKQMYPKLRRYHLWWYENRDHNKNGLCEYGSADGTRIAAAWESGMDNAVRFDKAVLAKNNTAAWSLNQESVDLNAYLYAEKIYLAKIAGAINLKAEAAQWTAQLPALKKQINAVFYHADKGFYYDRLFDGSWIEAEGPEGWIPLWAGISSPEQAKAVQQMMEKEHKFNTLVPLPTLAADHSRFDPLKGYWRGPVWLDQVYFGLAGLQKYGYRKEAGSFLSKLLQNAEGLSGQGAIRENYHPQSGKGLNAKNFSWSAAHILMLLKENTL